MSPGVPTESDSTLPRRAGGFELERELGRGGMGVVYLARELASGRQVALKVLLADLTLSDEAFERFKREARVAAAISDSRCVFVYGAHQIEGAPAISMELVGGETLEHRLARKQPIPVETAVRWTIEILEGLEAASMTGIVHRDVKPSNCFVTAEGHVKIGDFGLSRSLGADMSLTQTGQFLGSPLYASPEQVRGRDVDVRSDLYSCGATLYALLTGHPPHAGANIGEVFARILSEDPPSVRLERAEIPRGLERVVQRAMARDPKQRFQTHADMRAALMPFVSSANTNANLGMRVGAYLIDVACYSTVSNALFSIVTAIAPEFARVDAERPWRLVNDFAMALQLLVPFLYFALLEGFWGAGPGKLVCGLRVTSLRSDAAGRWSVALRAAVFELPRIAPIFLLLTLNLSKNQVAVLAPSAPIVATLLIFLTARPSNGWRGVHEFLSRTRVVRRRAQFASVSRVAPPKAAVLARTAGAPAQAGAYTIAGCVGEMPHGVVYQAHDTGLDRPVWLLHARAGQPPIGEARRSDARAGRIRWLEAFDAGGERFEVFESPGGASWLTVAERGDKIAWPTMHRLLSSLVDALEAQGGEPIALEQLWIDRSWSARVLDAPARANPGAAEPATALLVRAARALAPKQALLPVDLPGHAESATRRLFGLDAPFESLAEAAQALQAMEHHPQRLTQRTRAAQLAFSAAAPVLMALLSALGLLIVTPYVQEATECEAYALELQRGAATITALDGAESTRPLTDEQREAREILIASWWRAGRSMRVDVSLDDATRLQIDRALELHPSVEEKELDWARANVGSAPLPDAEPAHGFRIAMWSLPAIAALLWGVSAAISALCMPGGVSFRVFGVLLRDRRGRRASRLRSLARGVLVWVPLVALYATLPFLYQKAGVMAALSAAAVVALLHAGAIAYALWRPERGLQDRLLGTRLVPR